MTYTLLYVTGRRVSQGFRDYLVLYRYDFRYTLLTVFSKKSKSMRITLDWDGHSPTSSKVWGANTDTSMA